MLMGWIRQVRTARLIGFLPTMHKPRRASSKYWLVERAIAETWGQSEARRAVLERNVPTAENTIERRMRKLRQEVLAVDPEHLSFSTRAEAKMLLDALRPLASKATVSFIIQRALFPQGQPAVAEKLVRACPPALA
jgi:hypothetical protein